jgi:hypothetical protein
MMLGPILLTWILLGTVSTVQCKGTDCRPTRTSATVAGPHTMAVFHSPTACEAYRLKMEQLHQTVVHAQTRPDVTVRKQMTYTCQEGGEGL